MDHYAQTKDMTGRQMAAPVTYFDCPKDGAQPLGYWEIWTDPRSGRVLWAEGCPVCHSGAKALHRIVQVRQPGKSARCDNRCTGAAGTTCNCPCQGRCHGTSACAC